MAVVGSDLKICKQVCCVHARFFHLAAIDCSRIFATAKADYIVVSITYIACLLGELMNPYGPHARKKCEWWKMVAVRRGGLLGVLFDLERKSFEVVVSNIDWQTLSLYYSLSWWITKFSKPFVIIIKSLMLIIRWIIDTADVWLNVCTSLPSLKEVERWRIYHVSCQVFMGPFKLLLMDSLQDIYVGHEKCWLLHCLSCYIFLSSAFMEITTKYCGVLLYVENFR